MLKKVKSSSFDIGDDGAKSLAGALGDFLSGGKRRESAARRLREAESLRSRYRVLVRRKEDGWVEIELRASHLFRSSILAHCLPS